MTTWPVAEGGRGRPLPPEGEGGEAVDVRKTKKMRAGPFPVWWSTTILYVSSAFRVYLSCGSFFNLGARLFSSSFFSSFSFSLFRVFKLAAQKSSPIKWRHTQDVSRRNLVSTAKRKGDNRSSRSPVVFPTSIHCVNLSWGWCLNFFLVSPYPRFFFFFFFIIFDVYLCVSSVGKLIMRYVVFFSIFSLPLFGGREVWDIFAGVQCQRMRLKDIYIWFYEWVHM